MALPHAQLLDVVRVRPLGADLRSAVSTSLLKTDRLQLLHLVLPNHKDQPEHHVDDECVVQCLEGDVEVVMPSGTRRLRQGDLIVLPGKQPHALRARADSALLVTLLLQDGDAGDGGGAGARALGPRGGSADGRSEETDAAEGGGGNGGDGDGGGGD